VGSSEHFVALKKESTNTAASIYIGCWHFCYWFNFFSPFFTVKSTMLKNKCAYAFVVVHIHAYMHTHAKTINR
jgi:hypothetical protein